MNENLTQFKMWCRDAFRFLLDDHGFEELDKPHPKHANEFQVRFGNGIIELLILGEGYVTVANIAYVVEDGTEVGTELLEPGWEPFKKRNKRRANKASQQAQIFLAATRIKERDADILSGDLTRLKATAERWRTICAKMNWK